MTERTHTVLFSPSTGQMVCPMIQSGHNYKARDVSPLFNRNDYMTNLSGHMIPVTHTLEDWKKIASLARAERATLFKTKPDARDRSKVLGALK